MSFFSTLVKAPPATPLSRLVMWNGVFYMVFSATFLLWPEAAQAVLGAAPFQAGEAGLARAIGALGVVIGWFYAMGARTGAPSFCLATIVDRLVFVLPVFALLGATRTVDPHIAFFLAAMDTVLALVTLGVWWKTRATA